MALTCLSQIYAMNVRSCRHKIHRKTRVDIYQLVTPDKTSLVGGVCTIGEVGNDLHTEVMAKLGEKLGNKHQSLEYFEK